MNTTPFLAGCLLLASSAAALADADSQARQAPSCGEWVVHREKSDTMALGNASWLLGYLSGVASGSGKDFLTGTENSAIYKWIDAYCRKNPLRNVGSGANALAAELGVRKETPK